MDVMYYFMWLTWFGERTINRYISIDSRTFVQTLYDDGSCPVVQIHRKANSRLPGQECLYLLCNPRVRHRIQYIGNRESIKHHLFKIRFHIMFLGKSICLKWSTYMSRGSSNLSLI
jgi:hypothetical protein